MGEIIMNCEMSMNAEPNELSIQPFTEVLLSNEIKDIGIDVSEIFLDSYLDDMAILQDLPALKSFVAVGKTVKNIQAWFEWKNQLAFLSQLKKGRIDEEGLKKRNKAYRNKEKWVIREVEALVVHMSKYTVVEKAKLQAELYIDLINGVITQNRFSECLDILLHLFLSDIPHLLEIYQAEVDANLTEADWLNLNKKINTKFDATICRRLMAVGLLHQLHPMSFGFSMDNYFVTSDTGKYFCSIIQRCISVESDEDF